MWVGEGEGYGLDGIDCFINHIFSLSNLVRIHSAIGILYQPLAINFVMNHAPGAGSIDRPIDQQYSALSLYHGPPVQSREVFRTDPEFQSTCPD